MRESKVVEVLAFFKQFILQAKLGPKLVLLIVGCSTVLALLVTLVEGYSFYTGGKEKINQRHQEVLGMIGDVLVEQLWNLDESGAEATIQGLYRIEAVDKVELSREDSSLLTLGEVSQELEIETIYPLYKVRDGESFDIGQLRLYSNLGALKSEALSQLGLRLFLNFIKSLIVSAVVLYCFHRLVTIHMNKITDYAASMMLGQSYQPLYLDRKEGAYEDELQTVVDSINFMGSRLQDAHELSEEDKSELKKQVVERTKHLERTNKRLVEKNRLATIGSLVALVAHEMRNPLGSIKATVHLLEARCHDDSELRAIERINRNIDRCNETVEQLRRMGSNSHEHWRELDFGKWLQAYLTTKTELSKSICVDCDLDNGLKVFVDEFQLGLVIRNLIENAQQAMAAVPMGSGHRLLVTLRHEQGAACLTISDTGVGMDEETLQRALDPLFTTKKSGFGMGLALSHNLIQAFGGEVELSSSGAFQGASVRLAIPLVDGSVFREKVGTIG